MPQMKSNRGEVLSWNEVHAQFVDTAQATPIADIDRQLGAMGYDLDKVGAAIHRLNGLAQHAVEPGAVTAAVTTPRPGSASSPPEIPEPQLLRRGWDALVSCSIRARSAAAGAVALILVAVVALPLSHIVVERWLGPASGMIEKVARPTTAVEEQVEQLIQSVKVAVDPLGFARNLNKAGQILEAADRSGDAVMRYFEAIALFEDHTDKFKPSPLIATIAHNLARLLAADNRLEEAEKLLERALEINMLHFGPKHPIVARDLDSLNMLHRARNLCTKPSRTCAI